MSIFQAIFLGILQGVAEFLPVSSSGHLALAQKIFGLDDVPLLFDVFLHLATLFAVILFFRKKIASLIVSFVKIFLPKKSVSADSAEKTEKFRADGKYIAAILAATIITGVLGIISSKFVENFSIKFVCAGFIVTSVLLILSSVVEKKRDAKKISAENSAPNLIQALIVGAAQGFGTLPGISRSGSTISFGVFCGIDRKVAGEFSFVVSIPAILGAFVLELKDLGEISASVGIVPLAAGCLCAFFSGFAALAWLMKLIENGKLHRFAFYLIPLGILGIILL